jgi:hypothetical protein
MRYRWYLSAGGPTSELTGEFDAEPGMTDTDIEQLARELAFNEVDWGYYAVDGDE